MPHHRTASPLSLITGGTTGIGRALAEILLKSGHSVIVTSRDRARADQIARELSRWGDCTGLELELSDPGSVRAAADQVMRQVGRLDVLVNNAARWSSRRELTPRGVEKTWAANVLGHFQLTQLLTPMLTAHATARVVFVASGLAHSLSLDDLDFEHRRYRGILAYAQSKQALRMLTRAFARRFATRGVTVNSAHPGFTRTPAFANGGGALGLFAGAAAKLFGQSPKRGAETIAWLVESDALAGVSGGYFQDRQLLPCEHTNEPAEEALFEACRRSVVGVPVPLRRVS
jgi:retinol dehydrogenase 12